MFLLVYHIYHKVFYLLFLKTLNLFLLFGFLSGLIDISLQAKDWLCLIKDKLLTF